MQTASFSGTIETIIYIIIFYYVFKLLAKIFLPYIIKHVINKFGQNLQQQYQAGNFQNKQPADKDEIINSTSKTDKPRESKKVGEYVDYEEID